MPTTRKNKHTAKNNKKTNGAKHHTTKKAKKEHRKSNVINSGKHINVTDAKTASALRTAMKNGRVIVLYHAEWCGHCKDFMPEWQKFVAVMKNKPEVDCVTAEVESANLGLLPDAGVQGFPTIRYYNTDMRHRAPSENTASAMGLGALFGLADNTRAAAGKSQANNGTDYTGASTSNALLEYVTKNSSKSSQSGGAKQQKQKKDDSMFKALVKEGLDPKKLTKGFKREYRRLERASKHATATIRSIKKSLGFKH